MKMTMMMMTRHGFCFELGGFKNGFFQGGVSEHYWVAVQMRLATVTPLWTIVMKRTWWCS